MSKPFDKIITIDFETYWDTKEGYTLSKMTTEEYIRHDKFRAFGACVHVYGSDEPIRWFGDTELREYLDGVDWGRTAVLAHNAQFDVSIMEWRYNARPCFIFDTLSMARALRGVEVGNSLAKLASDFGLPDKGTAVHSTNGVHELDAALERELAEYCKHDVFLCEEIFRRLVDAYPSKELRLVDMTLKMYTRPVLQLDPNMLTDAILDEKEKREALLQKLGVEETALASNQQFAALLKTLNVVPPTKVSKTTGKEALALAKSDALFQTLLNSEREDVALLCEARLRVKSTTERTRAQRFLEISQRGALPVPLSYYGAQTGRWTASKGSAINMQNLKRGSFLRKAIMAPDGHQLVVGDLSQIEPRVLAWLSDYTSMLDIFRAGGDPYAAFGAQMFNIPNLTKESHPDLRQSAKSALLGCGYGLGWASFASQLTTGFLGAPPVRYEADFARQLGVSKKKAIEFLSWQDTEAKLRDIPHTCSLYELAMHAVASKRIIDIYRATAYPVVGFWQLCETMIDSALYHGKEHTYKCLTFKKGRIELPNGMSLHYPDLRREKDEKGRDQWVYGADATKLYAGKVTNNVTQALARIVMTDGMLRVSKRYFIAGTVHDELIAVVPDAEVEEAKTWVLAQMTMEPSYMQGIPLSADGGAHRRYGLAKN
jgi:DNA polymerase bacteriophage-type